MSEKNDSSKRTKIDWQCSRPLSDPMVTEVHIEPPLMVAVENGQAVLPVKEVVVYNSCTDVIIDDEKESWYNSVDVKCINIPPEFNGDIVDYAEFRIKEFNPQLWPDPDYKPAA